MQIYNSLTNKKEEFKTIVPNEVSMYVCGPTVYNYIHIGNSRPVIFFDVVKRYFQYKGYKVTYASNITDVDDKIIQKAIENNCTEAEITKKYIDAFWEDVKSLGSKRPDVTPYATEFIQPMIDFIQSLIDKGHAYEKDGDVYFRVLSIDNYGQLSNQRTEALEMGARISIEDKKESPLDFTLWKKTNEGIKWNSPWGMGRPGWHTECVVMIDSVFGHKIDIHGGGTDLKFPHHENEIAQSVACNNHSLANFWMHVGRLDFNNEKMSKSLGNVVWVKELLKEYHPNAFRMLILNTNYRQPINYTVDLMNQFKAEYEKLERSYRQAFVYLDINDLFNDLVDNDVMKLFEQYMDDDFNTANVSTIISDLLKKMNVALRNKNEELQVLFNTLKVILDCLGIDIPLKRFSKEDKDVYFEWENARKNKDFGKADELRGILVSKGLL